MPLTDCRDLEATASMLMDGVRENRMIDALVRSFSRSPEQVNKPHESDAELIRIPGTDLILALTADAIVEEIEIGLYEDPFLIGWMAVTASLSDLAAVGAEPLGVLIVESLPRDFVAQDRLQQGIQSACEDHGVSVLGGDTNRAAALQIAGMAVGTVSSANEAGFQEDAIVCPLTRRGARAGQAVCATGPLGLGSAFAAMRMLGQPFAFRPRARLAEGILLRHAAACCIDTSDGAFAALDQLMRLNAVGFLLDGPASCIHPGAQVVARRLNVPPWMMLAGLHGEFELIFCIDEEHLNSLFDESSDWRPLRIGTVTAEPCVEIKTPDGILRVDTGHVRDLFESALPTLEDLIQQIHACTRIRVSTARID